ncbi:MAG: MFS transporter [Firmicutes bacterium]|nr:MFS transporter [Bacillota bacterium]
MTMPQARITRIVAGALLAIFVGAMNGSIIDTVAPTIVGELGGFSLYAWIYTASLIAGAAVTLVAGRLADLYGRRALLLGGLLCFALGSILCASAHQLPVLIAGRGLQGVGAGTLLPLASTLIGDLFSGAQRARMQGVATIVWAIAACAAPVIGGSFVQWLHWRDVFWMNLPLAAATAILLWPLPQPPRRLPSFDLAGTLTLLATITTLMLAISLAPASLSLWLAGATVVLALIWWQTARHAEEPILPIGLLRLPTIATSMIAAVCVNLPLTGTTAYLPLVLQGVGGLSPTASGAVLLLLSLGWSLGANFVTPLARRLGIRSSAACGFTGVAIGTGLLTQLPRFPLLPLSIAAMAMLGIGMGITATLLTLLAQHNTRYEIRGGATSALTFAENTAGAAGTALAGTLLHHFLQHHNAATLLDELASRLALHPPSTDPALQAARQTLLVAYTPLAAVMLIPACAVFAVLLWLPKIDLFASEENETSPNALSP